MEVAGADADAGAGAGAGAVAVAAVLLWLLLFLCYGRCCGGAPAVFLSPAVFLLLCCWCSVAVAVLMSLC